MAYGFFYSKSGILQLFNKLIVDFPHNIIAFFINFCSVMCYKRNIMISVFQPLPILIIILWLNPGS